MFGIIEWIGLTGWEWFMTVLLIWVWWIGALLMKEDIKYHIGKQPNKFETAFHMALWPLLSSIAIIFSRDEEEEGQ